MYLAQEYNLTPQKLEPWFVDSESDAIPSGHHTSQKTQMFVLVCYVVVHLSLMRKTIIIS